ncbi:unnamed protein product [Rotaria magnacalcarata]|uniref:Uncharacterized protein n=2 Tax=Rotaria magnacalcarata TaxID=392030 RepID=A0A816ZBI7_9BILA|nr:unnamed protein product [Rotaria magnacalcarata]
MERRNDVITRESLSMGDEPDDYDDDMNSDANNNDKWSLQDAVASTLNQFLDRSETINLWRCGLDLKLDTWKQTLFSRHGYDKRTEQQKRLKMKQYAMDDCIAVAQLFFHMCPRKARNHEQPQPQTTTITVISTRTIIDVPDHLSDISEDELIKILTPKFNRPEPTLAKVLPNNQPPTLTIEVTSDEINKFNSMQEQIQQQQSQTPTTALTKSERQRKKNMKLKWKQKHHPNFQHKIIRPIYHKYDYRKIRAQLKDDDIYTSHQITINKNKLEVSIGFKSFSEENQAREKIPANYFSKEQHKIKWG